MAPTSETIEKQIKYEIATSPTFSDSVSNDTERNIVAKAALNEYLDTRGMPKQPFTKAEAAEIEQLSGEQGNFALNLTKKYGDLGKSENLKLEKKMLGIVKRDPALKGFNPAQKAAAASILANERSGGKITSIRQRAIDGYKDELADNGTRPNITTIELKELAELGDEQKEMGNRERAGKPVPTVTVQPKTSAGAAQHQPGQRVAFKGAKQDGAHHGTHLPRVDAKDAHRHLHNIQHQQLQVAAAAVVVQHQHRAPAAATPGT